MSASLDGMRGIVRVREGHDVSGRVCWAGNESDYAPSSGPWWLLTTMLAPDCGWPFWGRRGLVAPAGRAPSRHSRDLLLPYGRGRMRPRPVCEEVRRAEVEVCAQAGSLKWRLDTCRGRLKAAEEQTQAVRRTAKTSLPCRAKLSGWRGFFRRLASNRASAADDVAAHGACRPARQGARRSNSKPKRWSATEMGSRCASARSQPEPSTSAEGNRLLSSPRKSPKEPCADPSPGLFSQSFIEMCPAPIG